MELYVLNILTMTYTDGTHKDCIGVFSTTEKLIEALEKKENELGVFNPKYVDMENGEYIPNEPSKHYYTWYTVKLDELY